MTDGADDTRSYGEEVSLAAAWLMATRPRTLSAALVPVLVGAAVADAHGALSLLPVAAALAGAVLLQIGANLANDYFDYVNGADTDERLGPTRVTQAGLIQPDTMKFATALCFLLATVVGAWLVWHAGWPIVAIGVASIIAALLYTGGPLPYGYVGLGDLFVFVFFGLVAVAGTYYVSALELHPDALWAAVPIGTATTAILVVNNLRDADTDAKAGKRTLAVRFGKTFARWEYVALLVVTFAVPVVLAWTHDAPWLLLPLASMPLAAPLTRAVFAEEGRALNPVLGRTAALLLIYGILFAAAWWLSPTAASG